MKNAIATGAALATLLAASFAFAQEADPYDAAMARAAELEARGDRDGAAATLGAMLASYPQDYALPLAIGAILLRAHRFEGAARAYRMALAITPSGAEAQAGLAAALAAQEGTAASAPRPTFRGTFLVAGTGHAYPDHPYKAYGVTATGALDLEHASGWTLGATYHYVHFFPTDTSPLGAFDQHEVHARTGYASPSWGIEAQYAFADDLSGFTGVSHHAGLSLRLSPFGDIMVNGALSFYSDELVFRLEPSWRIPVAGPFSVIPGFSVQRAGAETLGAGRVTLLLAGEVGTLFLGGKYGTEVRPASLDQALIENVSERIGYGMWAGGSLNVGSGFGIRLSYALERLNRTDGVMPDATFAHFLTLGLAKSF